MSDRVVLEQDRGLGVLLDDAFTLLFRHLGTALLLTAAVVVPVELLVSGVGLGQLTATYNDQPTEGQTVFVSLVPLLVTMPLVTGMLARLVHDDAAGEPVSFVGCLRGGLQTFPYLLPVVVLSTVGIVAGMLAFIVPGLFLAIRWAVVAPAVAVEGERGTAALRRSWSLVTGHGWWVLGTVIVLSVLISIVGALIALPFNSLADRADRQVLDLVGSVVGQVLALPFSALATLLLFFTLRARHGGAARTSGPAWPAAPEVHDAFGRETAAEHVGSAGPPPGADAPQRTAHPGWSAPAPGAPGHRPAGEGPVAGTGERPVTPRDGTGGRSEGHAPPGWAPPRPGGDDAARRPEDEPPAAPDGGWAPPRPPR